MRLHGRYPVVVALVGCLILFQWGCASKQAKSPPLAREGADVVGVVTPSETWKGSLKPPSGKGAAAARGAGRGALAGAQPGFAILQGMRGCGGGGPVGAVICGSLALVGLGITATGGALGALAGAVHGAANTESPSEEITGSLNAAITQLQLQEALVESVLSAGAYRRAELTFVRLPNGPPPQSGKARATHADGPNVDTILEVALDDIQLRRYGSGPQLWVALVVSARARLIRATDGRELRRHVARHQSTPWSYEEWAADDARPLREALAVASTSMATDIVDVVLGEPAQAPLSPTPVTDARGSTTNFGPR